MSSVYILLCLCCLGLVAALSVPPFALEDAELHFENFIKEYGKQYADEHEKQERFQIFKDNLIKANRMNEKRSQPLFGITQFSDLTLEELNEYYSCLNFDSQYQDSCTYLTDADINYSDAPESFDWRDRGVVNPVEDQKHCGSCYAFSAAGNIEGQYAIKYNQLPRLSKQQIVDCDQSNGGCHGGMMSRAFRYLIEQGGIEGETDYPYEDKQGACRFDGSNVKVKLANCYSYNLTSQEKVKQLLYHTGPISITIKHQGLPPMALKGIISDQECDVGNIDHAVLLVGYGTENGEQYWIVKNSWSDTWNEQGYFRMQRGEGALSCGMMNDGMASAVVA